MLVKGALHGAVYSVTYCGGGTHLHLVQRGEYSLGVPRQLVAVMVAKTNEANEVTFSLSVIRMFAIPGSRFVPLPLLCQVTVVLVASAQV